MDLNSTSYVWNEKFSFTWHDYVLFSIMLFLSLLIGIFFGCTGDKQSTADEYLLGGRKMGVLPIAMSLIASYVSSLTLLAIPADMYQFGFTYGLNAIMVPMGILLAHYTFVPVFIKLQLTSTFEYLQLRFDARVRWFCSFLFALTALMYQPLVIYGPALALAQGTGFNIHHISPVICGICIIYTTLGGLKAVVWTDTLQMCLMILSTMACTYLGTVATGGVAEVFRVSEEGRRLDLVYDFDPTKRDSFWTGTIGVFFTWFVQFSSGQACIQKYVSLPSMQAIRRATIIFALGLVAFFLCSTYAGLMIYTKYRDCDPLRSSKITKTDQLLPYFILDVSRNVPGLSGLFIAGVFSAALSSLSACMNCLSCTLYEDFLSHKMPKDISQKAVSNILKLIVLAVGIISIALIYVVESLGGILELSFSLSGITTGPQLGIFSLGILVPFCNAKGALYGGIGATIIMAWMSLGSQYYKMKGLLPHRPLPTSIEGCDFNVTIASALEATSEWEPLKFYQISHYYYSLIGCCLVFIIGIPISWLMKGEQHPVDKDLISPVMQWTLPKTKLIVCNDGRNNEHDLSVLKEVSPNK